MNDQLSLEDELDCLETLATKASLYQAYAWLRSKRSVHEVEDDPYQLGALHGTKDIFNCPYEENSEKERKYCKGFDDNKRDIFL